MTPFLTSNKKEIGLLLILIMILGSDLQKDMWSHFKPGTHQCSVINSRRSGKEALRPSGVLKELSWKRGFQNGSTSMTLNSSTTDTIPVEARISVRTV